MKGYNYNPQLEFSEPKKGVPENQKTKATTSLARPNKLDKLHAPFARPKRYAEKK